MLPRDFSMLMVLPNTMQRHGPHGNEHMTFDVVVVSSISSASLCCYGPFAVSIDLNDDIRMRGERVAMPPQWQTNGPGDVSFNPSDVTTWECLPGDGDDETRRARAEARNALAGALARSRDALASGSAVPALPSSRGGGGVTRASDAAHPEEPPAQRRRLG